jgi:hypothetical protein
MPTAMPPIAVPDRYRHLLTTPLQHRPLTTMGDGYRGRLQLSFNGRAFTQEIRALDSATYNSAISTAAAVLQGRINTAVNDLNIEVHEMISNLYHYCNDRASGGDVTAQLNCQRLLKFFPDLEPASGTQRATI